MKQLIINGDDFGLAEEVNDAIDLAYREGALASASLMVGGRAAADAVQRAKRLAGLRVGLHLVVVEGRPLLPPSALPALVDGDGELLRNLVTAGIRFFFWPAARRQLELEIRAQFEAFRATGLELDHVNAHNHMHLHPTVLNLLVQVGQDFGLPAIRLPREPLRLPGRPWPKWLAGIGLEVPLCYVRRRLRAEGIAHNDYVLGLHDSGAMGERRVLELLGQLPEGTTELFFHPARGSAQEMRRDTPGYQHEQELAALLSPAVRARIESLGIRPGGYRDLSTRPPVTEPRSG